MSFENSFRSFVGNLNQQRSCMRFRHVASILKVWGWGCHPKNLGKQLKKRDYTVTFIPFTSNLTCSQKKCACVCNGLGEERPSQLLDNSLFYMKINDKCLLREKVGKAAPPLPFRCYVPALAGRRSTRLIVIVLMTISSTISIGSFMLP